MKSEQAQVAAIIRKSLKDHGIKARVKSRSASMMTAVDVTILQDVCPATAREIEVFVTSFQEGHFNGMEDIYEYNSNHKGPGVKYTQLDFQHSDTLRASARDWVAERLSTEVMNEWEVDRVVWRVLRGDQFKSFWTAHKPRLRAA